MGVNRERGQEEGSREMEKGREADPFVRNEEVVNQGVCPVVFHVFRRALRIKSDIDEVEMT